MLKTLSHCLDRCVRFLLTVCLSFSSLFLCLCGNHYSRLRKHHSSSQFQSPGMSLMCQHSRCVSFLLFCCSFHLLFMTRDPWKPLYNNCFFSVFFSIC